MNTAIAAIEEDINGAAPRNVGLPDAERMGVSHEESDRHGDEGGRHLAATVRLWLDSFAVVAAGA